MTTFFEHFKYDWKFITAESPFIYHYTDVTALKKILEDRKLWVSKGNFLNDYSELQYTKDVFNKVISKIKDDCDSEEIGFFELVEKDMTEYFARGAYGLNSSHIFVSSFSENEDSLTLWSNYSNYDGYNIGFNLTKMIELLITIRDKYKSFDTFYPGKVIYDEEVQQEMLYQELRRLYKEYRNCDDLSSECILQAQAACQVMIETYSMFFKKSVFKQEEEFRIAFLIYDSSKISKVVKYRIGKGSLIPFLEVPLYISSSEEETHLEKNNSPVQSVTIGPRNNIDIALFGLKDFLENRGYRYMISQMRKSQIPLRY